MQRNWAIFVIAPITNRNADAQTHRHLGHRPTARQVREIKRVNSRVDQNDRRQQGGITGRLNCDLKFRPLAGRMVGPRNAEQSMQPRTRHHPRDHEQ